ncbi:MAG: J domain-containing protein [Syntrophobacteraceae bacterium]
MGHEVHLDDDFRTLGLEPDAQPSEVKRAYRNLVKKWHPDRHQMESYETRALAEKKFLEIDEAYRRISKTWGPAPQKPRTSKRDSSRVRPAAPRPDAALSSKARFHSIARLYSRLWPNRHAASILAAATLLLLFFFPLTSSIAPDPRIRIPRLNLHRPSKRIHRAVKVQKHLPSAALHPALPGSQAPRDFFTLGSSRTEVLHIQGPPTRIQGSTWIYGVSAVHFNNGRVGGYNNFDGSLRVKLIPGSAPGPSTPYITLGSSEQQVIEVQGTPTRIKENRWYYGFAELIFEDGLVAGYDNYFGTLKIRLTPSAPADKGKHPYYFSKGSTPDDVLAVQGTPTAVHGNRWSYKFDYVFFRDGKVSGVVDADGALRFAVP